ncbi:MAG: type IV toxin-antitoxin system AbiEi family antitoxin domain-containing protein [Erysipelotrichaceae bacterium]|nr:type IV toxin-antitoxin system AbiEi family antitoxin domain-containing protein [Erysipelotrichaceae bacterium]
MNEDRLLKFQNIFFRYDGVMTTAELTNEKVYYEDIKNLLNVGAIEKIRRGYYHWCNALDYGDIIIIKKLYPDAVLCNETALLYYGYCDRNLREWHIAISKNASRLRFKINYPNVKARRVDPHLLVIGIVEGEINDIKVNIYDRDRTICDVLKNMNNMDREIFNKAIREYISDSQKNISNLLKYAKILRIENKVNNIIGVWL